MKAKYLLPAAIILVAAGTIGIRHTANAGARHAEHDQFVVHEWGTFTSMQGSDGVLLDGLQHEEQALPSFVHSLTERLPSPFARFGDPSANVRLNRIRTKMETPVIYFHSNKKRRAKVRVSYRGGLLSHYFPMPTKMGPKNIYDDPSNITNLNQRSFLEWDVEIRPNGRGLDIPAVEDGNHYGIARETSASPVRAFANQGHEDENFLFYRGIGFRAPQISVEAARGGSAVVRNKHGDAIPAAFALEVDGGQARFVRVGTIKGNDLGNLDLSKAVRMPLDKAIEKLSKSIEKDLVLQGLFQDEASAMVRTWATSWFGEQGTRLIYIVPQSHIERVLPLQIEPSPDKTVRVLVGRLEYLTPEKESQVAESVRKSASSNRDSQVEGMRELAALGRFLEPMLRRTSLLATDGTTRKQASSLLATLTGIDVP